jgi:hypothetical protein
MKKILLQLTAIFFFFSAFSQKEKFDIASYIPPAGWERVDSNGIVMYYDMKSVDTGTAFCQIFLFPSHKAAATPAKDFAAEWASRVVKSTRSTVKPKVSSEKTPDNWTVTTGYANITQQGITYTCMLVCISGFGREMTVRVNMAGQDYLTAVNNFFTGMDMDLSNSANAVPASTNTNIAVTTPVGPGDASLSNYTYTVPSGWNEQKNPDGIVLTAPPINTGERCNMIIWPMRAAGASLVADAAAVYAEVFKDYQPTNRDVYTQASVIRGLSPQGWEYFITKGPITLKGGNFATMFGFVFIAKIGTQDAVITGISKDPLVSACFGLNLTDVWPKFLYSLHFKNWTGSLPAQTMINKIAGVWMSVTGTAGDRIVFAGNGRYSDASAVQRYTRLSSTEVLRETDAYFGDGKYSISGNNITMTSDKDKSHPTAGWYRWEQESKNNGATWSDKLYLLRISKVDGAEY